MGVRRIDLYTGYQNLVEPDERARLRELIRRRARREPVAYILGEKEFFSLSFRVSPAVLIPRPETEHVVEACLDLLRAAGGGSVHRLLDLGTGSGNIAVAVAVHESACAVDAVDISEDALEVARENARRHAVADRVRFLRGDLFEPLVPPSRVYRIIACNPPYVRPGEMSSLMDDVRLHEPRLALLDSKSAAGDGLGFYRELAERSCSFLTGGGAVVVEVGTGQAEAVRSIFRSGGLGDCRTIRDYGGTERVVVAARG